MNTKNPRQENAPWLTPAITVNDISESLSFYEKAFGFQPGLSMPDESGALVYADMKYKGELVIMLMQEGGFGGTCKTPQHTGTEPAIGLYVYCDDVDALYNQAKQAGVAVTNDPEDMFWGDRVTQLKDPDGHNWSFATKVRDFEPEAVPV